jgi:hypothetical protein
MLRDSKEGAVRKRPGVIVLRGMLTWCIEVGEMMDTVRARGNE